MTTFSMTEVCHAVMREGITAYIEHTGSGVMTIFAGSQLATGVWTVAAGPGRYPAIITEGEMDAIALTQAQPVVGRHAVGDTENFSVGPGNMQEWVLQAGSVPRVAMSERVWTCPELATVAEIADEIIRQVREHAAQTPVVAPAKTWPETEAERDAFIDWQYEVGNGDTLRSFRDWLAVKEGRD